jgi:hypothetical protein
MRSTLFRLLSSTLGAGGFVVLALAASPSLAAASAPSCSGTVTSPGTLAGDYGNVAIEGVCFVNAGHATVHGTLTLRAGSALIAAFAHNDQTGTGTSGLTVLGNVRVRAGASLLLGCEAAHFACIDDPSQEHPTLSSSDRISGDLTEVDPLGVIVHTTAIGGSVNETGGGGGFTCDPSGVFAAFGSPVYSDYEDTTIGGSLQIRNLTSCWLGVARVHSGGNFGFTKNRLKDPDAIEIIDNHVGGDLACRDNSMVWDSAEAGAGLYPRQPEPNTVTGTRSGQCVLATPITDSGNSGPGPF